ncbi:MAG TPA: hypothetical protein VNV65_03170 [Candidatus Solibacter sp.]|nr:hypothetical protein [Candidatus Solibacter sp.]
MALRAAVALGAALVLGACAGPAPAAQASPSPNGSAAPASYANYTLHADTAAGYQLRLPTTWLVAVSDSRTINDDLAAISATNPDIGGYLTRAMAASVPTGLALLGADPQSVSSGFTTNAAVFRIDLGPSSSAPDLGAITEGKLQALDKDSTISGIIDERSVQLAGNDARRLFYVFKSGSRNVDVVTHLLVVDRDNHRIEYELTMGSEIAEYAQLFDKIAASFWLGPFATPSPG